MKYVWTWLVFLAAIVAGCGGGGGSTDPVPQLAITAQPTDQSVLVGQPAEFSVDAAYATGYQWQVSEGGAWSDVAGASGTTYRIDAATLVMAGRQYRALVTGAGSQLISSAATLQVTEAVVPPSIVAEPVGQVVLTGQDAVFNVTATGSSLAYQWQLGADGGSWSDVTGATTAQLLLQAVGTDISGTSYRVQVSNSAGVVMSGAASLRVDPIPVRPVFIVQPASRSVVVGQVAAFTVVAVGTPVPELKWQMSADGLSWADIAGASGPAYTTGATSLSDNGKRFRAVATNSAGTADSSEAVLSVTPAPSRAAFTVQPRSVSATVGTRVSFTVAVVGTPQPALQWQTSFDAVTWFNINGATSLTYSPAPISGSDNGTLYRAVATNPSGSAYSSAAVITVSTVASGSPSLSLLFGTLGGSGGLDGTGSAARLSHAKGLAVDSSGRFVIADAFGQTVRRMTASGAVTSWVGFYGSSGAVDGIGPAARFAFPAGVAIDAQGNTYVADKGNKAVRKISPAGAVTTRAHLLDVSCIVVDANGVLYAGDFGAITRIEVDGTVSTLAGLPGLHGYADGTGDAARFGVLLGIAFSANGDLLVTDSANTVRRVTAAGVVSTVAGVPSTSGSTDGSASIATFNQPSGLAVDSLGNIFVADTNNHAIRKISAAGLVSTVAGDSSVAGVEDGSTTVARFLQPEGLAFTASGDLFVADTNRIRKISGSVVSTVAGKAAFNGVDLGSAAADSAGNVYVSDGLVHAIRKIAPDGTSSVFANVASPGGIVIDASNNVFVTDVDNHTVLAITPAGTVRVLAGLSGRSGSADGPATTARFNNPLALALDAAGRLYVADRSNHTIRKILPDGTVSTISGLAGVSGYANGVGAAARYSAPHSVAVNTQGILFVADDSGVVRRIDTSGNATDFAGNAQVFGSADGAAASARFGHNIALTMWGGVLHLADGLNGTLRAIDANGNVSTVAGLVGQVGVRLGSDPRFNVAISIAPLDANRLVISTNSEQSVLVLAK